MEYFRQCSLKNNNVSFVAWISEDLAKKDNWVASDEDGSLWQVETVGTHRVSKQEVLLNSRMHMKGFESIR